MSQNRILTIEPLAGVGPSLGLRGMAAHVIMLADEVDPGGWAGVLSDRFIPMSPV